MLNTDERAEQLCATIASATAEHVRAERFRADWANRARVQAERIRKAARDLDALGFDIETMHPATRRLIESDRERVSA